MAEGAHYLLLLIPGLYQDGVQEHDHFPISVHERRRIQIAVLNKLLANNEVRRVQRLYLPEHRLHLVPILSSVILLFSILFFFGDGFGKEVPESLLVTTDSHQPNQPQTMRFHQLVDFLLSSLGL